MNKWQSSYFVGSEPDIDAARRLAMFEVGQRGGKFGCIIYDISIPGRDEYEIINSFDWSKYKQLDL